MNELIIANKSDITNIANAVRQQTDNTESLSLDDIVDGIYSLPKVNQLHATLDGSLTEIDSPATTVISYACRGLSKLKTVNLPNATRIYPYAFYGCSSLTSINAPKAASIDAYSFQNCTSLVSVCFQSANSVNMYAFRDCTALIKVDLSALSTLGGGNNFNGCSSLETLILRRDTVASLGNTTAFAGTPIEAGTGYIYVPATLVDSYKSHTYWSTWADQIRAIEDYPDITESN